VEPQAELKRASSLERAGTLMLRASSNLGLQRANTLPTEPTQLQHAATMPIMFDQEADRPWCGGLWKTQQLVGFVLGVGMAVALTCARPISQYPQANLMLAMTALCASFWVFEVIPLFITALFPIMLLPLLKISSSDIVAQAYWNWISLLVIDVCILSIALEKVGVARRVALKILLKVGVKHPGPMLVSFMGLGWLLSALVNCIAIPLLLTPLVVGLMQVAEEHVRNEHADAEAAEEGVDKAGLEQRLRKVQRLADCLLLGVAYSSTAGGLATLTGTMPHFFLAGETMIAGQVTWTSWLIFGLPISAATCLLAFGLLWLRYIRGMVVEGLDATVLHGEYETLVAELGKCSRDEVVIGLMQLLQVALMIIRPFAISPYLTSPYGDKFVNDATVAALPAVLLFFIPSVTRPGQALLTWPDFQKKFDFGLILLIGGALAISSGFVQSGLNAALGDAIAGVIPQVHPLVLNVIIIASVALCSQVLSSVGTAAAMLPVLESAALMGIVNPLSLILPAMVGTSLAFLLPTATPPNVIVLALSQDVMRSLRVRDFFSNGLPLTIMTCMIGAVLAHVMGAAVFDSDSPFPSWACEAAPGGCIFVDVPGVVNGRGVSAQACIVNLSPGANGGTCRLWNGTSLNTADYIPGF